jgi:hypothetical protein
VSQWLDTGVFERGDVNGAAGFTRPLGQAPPSPIRDYQDRY